MTYTFNDGGRAAAGFKGTAGDCGARAMAIALGIDYKAAYQELAQANKDMGFAKSARNGIMKTSMTWFYNVMDGFGIAPRNLTVARPDVQICQAALLLRGKRATLLRLLMARPTTYGIALTKWFMVIGRRLNSPAPKRRTI